jgi:hypothetical protein
MPKPDRCKRAARVQACSLHRVRQGLADTLVARELHASCTGSCTLLVPQLIEAGDVRRGHRISGVLCGQSFPRPQ